MAEKAVILDRDERMLQIQRNVGEEHVLSAFVHPEPWAAVRRHEPGVAHSAPQLVDGPRLLQGPRERDRDQDHQRPENTRGNPVAGPASHVQAENVHGR